MATLTYTANIAKLHFGKMIDEAQHSPITITKHNRDVAVVLSQKKIESYVNLLNDFFLEQVKTGKMTVLQALDNQAIATADMKQAEIDYHNGNCEEATPEFFEDVKKMAKAMAN